MMIILVNINSALIFLAFILILVFIFYIHYVIMSKQYNNSRITETDSSNYDIESSNLSSRNYISFNMMNSPMSSTIYSPNSDKLSISVNIDYDQESHSIYGTYHTTINDDNSENDSSDYSIHNRSSNNTNVYMYPYNFASMYGNYLNYHTIIINNIRDYNDYDDYDEMSISSTVC